MTTSNLLTILRTTDSVASGVTGGDGHAHVGGAGAPINLTTAVTGALPVVNGGTGNTTGTATDILNAPVIAKVLTGYTSGSGAISSSDSILSAIQKLNGNQSASLMTTVTKTGNYTAVSSDKVILCNAAGGSFTITLPAAASNPGLNLIVKKIDSSFFRLTIDANSSELIDGSLTAIINLPNATLSLVCNGSAWYII